MLFNIVNCCNIFMYNIITFLIFSQNKNKLSKLSVKQNSAIKCPLIHFLLVSYFQSLDASQLLKIIKNQFFSKNVEFINYRKSSFCRTYLGQLPNLRQKCCCTKNSKYNFYIDCKISQRNIQRIAISRQCCRIKIQHFTINSSNSTTFRTT